jgi:hypothetical protein
MHRRRSWKLSRRGEEGKRWREQTRESYWCQPQPNTTAFNDFWLQSRDKFDQAQKRLQLLKMEMSPVSAYPSLPVVSFRSLGSIWEVFKDDILPQTLPNFKTGVPQFFTWADSLHSDMQPWWRLSPYYWYRFHFARLPARQRDLQHPSWWLLFPRNILPDYSLAGASPCNQSFIHLAATQRLNGTIMTTHISLLRMPKGMKGDLFVEWPQNVMPLSPRSQRLRPKSLSPPSRLVSFWFNPLFRLSWSQCASSPWSRTFAMRRLGYLRNFPDHSIIRFAIRGASSSNEQKAVNGVVCDFMLGQPPCSTQALDCTSITFGLYFLLTLRTGLSDLGTTSPWKRVAEEVWNLFDPIPLT